MEKNLSKVDTEGFAWPRAGSGPSADTKTEELDSVKIKSEDVAEKKQMTCVERQKIVMMAL